MKYKSCHWITSGIHFDKNEIRFCCYEYLHGKSSNVIINPYNGKKIDFDKFFEIKKKYINLAKAGEVHPNCKNCIYLEEKEWSEENYFDHFIFNHWTKCNSMCIYCWQSRLPKEEKVEYYDVYPVLKDMQKKSLIKGSNSSCVVFGGGEPTILNNFDKIMELFLSENYKNIRINSSGIKYSKMLAQAIKYNCASIMISLDSGSKEMYEKIKRVKTYDIVWKNIDSYLKNSDYSNNIKIKYIILPGINDNITEINAFFEVVLKHNIKSVSVSIEDIFYKEHYPEFDNKLIDLIEYFIYNAEKYGLETEPTCEINSIIHVRENR